MKIKINTLELKEELKNLRKISDEYEKTITNLFNTLKNSSFFWKDNIATSFYNELDKEKIKNQKNLIELNDKIKIFNYIYNSYAKIGKQIECNLESEDYIKNKLNYYINKLNRIKKLYNSLDTSFCPNERSTIINQQNKIKDSYNQMVEIKNNITNLYSQISEIEIEISNKISKLNVIKIEIFDESRYIK